MNACRKRVTTVNVNFESSAINPVQRLGRNVPQLFNEHLEPIVPANQYLRLKERLKN